MLLPNISVFVATEDKDTLTIRDDLATALYDQDKFGQAEAEYRAVLKIREKVLGLHDCDTRAAATSGRRVGGSGQYAEAEAEHRAVLKIREIVFWSTDSDTLKSRDNLAAALDDEGKYPQAESEFRTLAKVRAEVLGPELPILSAAAWDWAIP